MNRSSRHALRLVALAALFIASRVGAFHDEPHRAKTLKASLVTSYVECTSPNVTTIGVPSLPACWPARRVDELCGFTDVSTISGYGKAVAKWRPNGDFTVNIYAKGLNAGCEGRKLCGVVRVRATTHRCVQGPCTVVDLDFTGTSPTVCCTVASGACSVSTTINNEVLGTLVVGDRTGLEVYGFGLKRVSGANLPAGNSFVSGGLTP